jgi:hypothetical protein
MLQGLPCFPAEKIDQLCGAGFPFFVSIRVPCYYNRLADGFAGILHIF